MGWAGREQHAPSPMHPCSLFRLPPDDDPEKRLHGRGFHVPFRRDFAHRVRDGPVLALVGRVLPEPRSTAHPNIHHHGASVPGDGAGECVGLQPPQPVETVRHAAIRRSNVGAQTLRRDALRILERLGLIVAPSNAGRECGHDASGHLKVPSGDGTERVSERLGLVVPRFSSVQVEEGSGGEERTELVGVGVVHGRIVTEGRGVCVGRGRNISEIILPGVRGRVSRGLATTIRGRPRAGEIRPGRRPGLIVAPPQTT